MRARLLGVALDELVDLLAQLLCVLLVLRKLVFGLLQLCRGGLEAGSADVNLVHVSLELVEQVLDRLQLDALVPKLASVLTHEQVDGLALKNIYQILKVVERARGPYHAVALIS